MRFFSGSAVFLPSFAGFFCRKAHNDQREMKLLLDMYKGVGKEMRDKAQLMAGERKVTRPVFTELVPSFDELRHPEQQRRLET